MEKAYLVLENGQVFEGFSFGAKATNLGELVFTTGVVGYLETLTDPAYYGQIVVQTFPLIGNYGVIGEDVEGKKCHLKGYVVREWCDTPSNFRCDYDIDKFLKEQNIPGIYGVDTREITKTIRENGVMNAVICSEVPEDISFLKDYKVTGSVSATTCGDVMNVAEGEAYKVAVMDLGAVGDTVSHLAKRGCAVTILPASASAEEILALDPDGIVLSNGGGDPSENLEIIEEIKKLVGKKAILGISLGHQLLAMANGGSCEKLKYGHRGGNQPAKDVFGSRSYMTSQNHGYVVLADTVDGAKLTYVNLNDNSCEGLEYPEKKALSVQFIPEEFKGPHDTSFIYDKFISLMGGAK